MHDNAEQHCAGSREHERFLVGHAGVEDHDGENDAGEPAWTEPPNEEFGASVYSSAE